MNAIMSSNGKRQRRLRHARQTQPPPSVVCCVVVMICCCCTVMSFISIQPFHWKTVVVAFTTTTTTTAAMHTSQLQQRHRSIIINNNNNNQPQQQQQQSQRMITRTTSTTTSTTALNAEIVSWMMNSWDDILYQTQSLGNTIASFSLPDLTSVGGGGSSSSNVLFAFPIMYIAGLLTSFSPCVWGLLPLTISYISTAANERSDQRTLLPTLAFAAGLAVVFCTMGMMTVFTVGSVFGSSSAAGSSDATNAMTYTMILPILSNFVCFLMGLQLLDLVNVSVPSYFKFLNPQQLFASPTSDRGGRSNSNTGLILLDATGRTMVKTTGPDGSVIHHDTDKKDNDMISGRSRSNDEGSALFRTFLLGGSSALVASPCSTPVLTSILAYVANAQLLTTTTTSTAESLLSSNVMSAMMGGFLLFGYTLGYSTPLLIVAATGGQALVRLNHQNQNTAPNQQQECERPDEVHNEQQPASFLSSIGKMSNVPNMIAPFVTPITGGILLYLGATGLLVNIIGDPSMIGLTIIE